MSFIPSVVLLGLIAAGSVLLALNRRIDPQSSSGVNTASKALAVAATAQALHFGEEWFTDFHTRFPALFGLEPIPEIPFLLFNVGLIVCCALSVFALSAANRLAFAFAWFLGLAGSLNGLAHPGLALSSGGYFPGLFSSPLVGLAGAFLVVKLWQATVATKRRSAI